MHLHLGEFPANSVEPGSFAEKELCFACTSEHAAAQIVSGEMPQMQANDILDATHHLSDCEEAPHLERTLVGQLVLHHLRLDCYHLWCETAFCMHGHSHFLSPNSGARLSDITVQNVPSVSMTSKANGIT